MNPPSIRADISGSWYNPDQSGHGLMVEVLDQQRAVVAWYTYDGMGAPLWLIGNGTIRGQEMTIDLGAYSGGRPPSGWAEGDLLGEPWGTVRLDFTGCNTANLTWESTHPDFGSGELPLQRLTRLQGESCYAEEFFSLQVQHSFERRMQGFKAVFADLPGNWQGEDFELDFRREFLPQPLSDYAGLRLTGHNRSDDLAMLVTGPIHGLQPGSLYRVEVEAEIASNVPYGCAGQGGSPGDDVYVKLGASGDEPVAETDPQSGWLRLNIDYGNQSQQGANARVAGTLANSQDCSGGPQGEWAIKRVTTQGQPLLVTAGDDGTLWVFAGTDSGYEGLSQFYVLSMTTRLEPYVPE